MRKLIRGLRRKSESYHMLIHFFLGMLCGVAMWHVFPGAPLIKLMSIGIIGGVLPDFDHILFIFLYGRKSEFSKIVKNFLKTYKIRNAISFIKINHKYNTAVYSHNMVSVLLAFSLFYYLYTVKDNASMSAFFLSWFVHYTFDIFEDVLFFKKINPNWMLKFNKTVKKDLSKLYEHDKKLY